MGGVRSWLLEGLPGASGSSPQDIKKNSVNVINFIAFASCHKQVLRAAIYLYKHDISL